MSRILVFDSGAGAAAMAAAIVRQIPGADIQLCTDPVGFPYGSKTEPAIRTLVLDALTPAVEDFRPDVIVIGCNTATLCAIGDIRARFAPIPVVGTVPAVKPAAQLSRTGRIGVMCTPFTAAHPGLADLARLHTGNTAITVIADPTLAAMAENYANTGALDRDRLASILKPFNDPDAHPDVIVLGCTHYSHLLGPMETALGRPALWLDSAAGVARRTKTVLSGTEAGRRERLIEVAEDPISID